MKYKKVVAAAHFARTNMGMPPVGVETLRRAFEICDYIEGAVEFICGDYIEADEGYDAFIDEARSWMAMRELDSVESIKTIWPDHAKLIEEALNEDKV